MKSIFAWTLVNHRDANVVPIVEAVTSLQQTVNFGLVAQAQRERILCPLSDSHGVAVVTLGCVQESTRRRR